MTNKELDSIVGGGISASLVSSFIRGLNLLLELGRSLGSAIRRGRDRNMC